MSRKSSFSSLCLTAFVTFFIVSLVSADTETFDEIYEDGKIKLDDLEVVVKEISNNTLRGKIGKGGKKISCRTSNGGIVLKKLK